VIGWAISNRMKQDLALRASDMATALRRPPPGYIHRTDRGTQYCAHEYQKRLRRHKLLPSMSGKGNCYDNSAVESFFKSLKAGRLLNLSEKLRFFVICVSCLQGWIHLSTLSSFVGSLQTQI